MPDPWRIVRSHHLRARLLVGFASPLLIAQTVHARAIRGHGEL
jgi:hypothetical protein